MINFTLMFIVQCFISQSGWMEKVDGSPPKTTYMSPEGNFYFSFTEVNNSGLLKEFLNVTSL
jgi:hypothetical protein